MPSPDDIMLKRKPKANPLYPDTEVPEGALVRHGLKLPSTVPYVNVGKRIYGRHTAVEVGVKGTF